MNHRGVQVRIEKLETKNDTPLYLSIIKLSKLFKKKNK